MRSEGGMAGVKRARDDAMEDCYQADRNYRRARSRAREARDRELAAARALAVAEERYDQAVNLHRKTLGLPPVAQDLDAIHGSDPQE